MKKLLLLVLILLGMVTLEGCNTAAPSPNEQIAAYHAANPDAPKLEPVKATPPAPVSGWHLDTDVNKMDGAVTPAP